MAKRVDKILIGKSGMNATAGVQIHDPSSAADYIANGEIVAVGADRKTVLTNASTMAQINGTMFLVQGTSATFTDNNGNTARVLRWSDPIDIKRIRSYKGRQTAAEAQQITTLGAAGFTPVAGEEYVVRIVYSDMYEHPGQFTQEYRVVATAAMTTVQLVYNAFRIAINGDVNSRVAATGTTTLILTGRAITQTMDSIDERRGVQFDVFMTSNNFGTTTNVLTQAYDMGEGTWKQVRDLEKKAKANEGITNRTHFPVPSRNSSWFTVENETYNLIVIEHDASVATPDNNYNKDTQLTTVLAIPYDSNGGATNFGEVLDLVLDNAIFTIYEVAPAINGDLTWAH